MTGGRFVGFIMGLLIVASFAVDRDAFAAGPDLTTPLCAPVPHD